jgi:hypothetical protein
MWHHYFAMTTGTTISCSLGRQLDQCSVYLSFPFTLAKYFFSRKSFKTKAVRLFLGSIFKYLHVMMAG